MEIMVYHWKMCYKEDRILLVLSYDSANFQNKALLAPTCTSITINKNNI